ncbi:Recombination protein MgsA [Candidatus Koribacter versatilis Ellin345]|uniref:Replication-associated recombination protein A n=1 Tax=Koribacter versatilis (strain Ellin345) TaxID=204669 RepID=Q1IND5_KORVE|nr:replication-associated recombination protein A [Candidatus Koribacter versatilis]ABF41615.1 Recombination protein MgsA [Candidatus Koribacter versatilis Ellin345]
MSLFDTSRPEQSDRDRPLADRMRPRTLDEFAGQEHILAPGKPLRVQIDRDDIGSLIFWGPPGVGKTTLAKIIAAMTHADFIEFSAVLSGIKEIKQVMADAERVRQYGTRTILFVDEIHRFNRAQQDAFLPHVERGNIKLIGATTENPSFEVNSALLSRSRVYTLTPLTEEQIVGLLRRALTDTERGLAELHVTAEDIALARIAAYASGDARSGYNVLEVAAQAAGATSERIITEQIVADALQRRVLRYDKSGEEHYNLISALHKSVRNSDPDAALYWLARMIESGEDALYIARRVVRMAVEDIGLADPNALALTLAAKDAIDFLGMPEANLALAQAVVYLSIAPKSNALYTAYGDVQADVEKTAADPVPLHLRNAPTKLMKEIGYGSGYQYAHDLEAKVADMQCLPDNLKDRVYYHPTDQGIEQRIRTRLEEIRRRKSQHGDSEPQS